MTEEFNLSKKLSIEGFRNDDWYNENIWGSDIDGNEIIELTLLEISKDVKEFIRLLKEEISNNSELEINEKGLFIIIDKLVGSKLL